MKTFRMLRMAKEWADELSKFKGYEYLVAKEAEWGFAEVEKGRNPDIVLKEVLKRIEDRACPSTEPTPVPNAASSLKSH